MNIRTASLAAFLAIPTFGLGSFCPMPPADPPCPPPGIAGADKSGCESRPGCDSSSSHFVTNRCARKKQEVSGCEEVIVTIYLRNGEVCDKQAIRCHLKEYGKLYEVYRCTYTDKPCETCSDTTMSQYVTRNEDAEGTYLGTCYDQAYWMTMNCIPGAWV